MTSTQEQLTQLLSGPAGTPPPGVNPDTNNLSSNQTYTILVLVLGLTFSTLAIIIRIYTKIFLMRTRAYEDCRSQYPLHLLLTALIISWQMLCSWHGYA